MATPQETTSLLVDSAQTARKAEEIGIHTMRTMQFQRERLGDAKTALYDTKDVMYSAKVSLREIESKAFRQKLCLWSVIFALGCANLAVIIVLMRNGGKFYHRGP